MLAATVAAASQHTANHVAIWCYVLTSASPRAAPAGTAANAATLSGARVVAAKAANQSRQEGRGGLSAPTACPAATPHAPSQLITARPLEKSLTATGSSPGIGAE